MTINAPIESQIPQLRRLWKDAFGDTDDFLDIFFSRGFSPERCRCITQNGTVLSALYWFDCSWNGKRLAYLYAVATHKQHQGKGLCRHLMEDTHHHLRALGYAGAILVPSSAELFPLYEKLGYRTCSYVQDFTCSAGGEPIPLKEVSPGEYAAIRRRLLPENSVIQADITLDFLSTYARLYAGENLTLAAYPDGEVLVVCELLGTPQSAPQILSSLGFSQGSFRTPGPQTPFAMYHSLSVDTATPAYLGLALD